MKRCLGLLILGILLLTNSINAVIKESDVVVYNGINYKAIYDNNRFEEITDYNDSNLNIENKSNNIKVFYKESKNSDNSIIRYGEWFKEISGKKVNFKQSIERGYRTKNQFYIETNSMAEFNIDMKKCQNNSEYINNNCQSKSKKKIENIRMSGTRVSIIQTMEYPNSAYSKDNAFSKVTIKALESDKLKKVYEIIAKRDKYNRVTNVKVFEFNRGNIETITESMKINPKSDLYDVNNVQSFGIKKSEFDENRKVSIFKITYMVGDNEIDTYEKELDYHSNGKVRLLRIQKRSLLNKLTYNRTNKYNNKGKKRGHIRYSYKKGVIILRREYSYNIKGTTKGNAYRYTTTYKKGKKVKSYRQNIIKKVN